ncbi:hypothetical protein GNP94_10540 [Paenibacillus campinasensis]|uniref:DUF541 domain-containing protein n=1 Tax=Paenibacillus campinasensis TaxID=66347 RepID=A0ABW9SZI0_9BACL|nr:YwmB family TATA-box binding protein [Paenibacillus campinasensis]MUG66435.1 hypothetical protein [Paenibacillus campinasensis]
MRQFGMKLWSLAMIISLLSGIVVVLSGCGVISGSGAGQRLERDKADAADQLRMLIDLGARQMEAGGTITVKLQGELINHASFVQAREAARQLASAIGLTEVREDQLHGNDVYHAEEVIGGIQTALNWAVTPDGNSYVRVMLTEERPDKVERLTALQQQVQTEMAALGIKADWNASMQGYAGQTAAVHETIAQVERELSPMLHFQQVENYEDVTTISRSYNVPDLPLHVMSGRQPIQMQIAVHEDSINKWNRITIGFPVITVEY